MSDVPSPGVMRIPVRFSRTLLIRGMAIWALSRLMVQALYMVIASNSGNETAAAYTNGNPIILAGWTLVLAASLVRIDLHRRHEVALLNNLGVVTSHAILLGTVPAVVMEVVMTMFR